MPVGDIRASLRAQIATVAISLLGEPNRSLSSHRQLRFGNQGAIAVEIDGPRAGVWFDHSAGIGGDALALIRHVVAADFCSALKIAESIVGATPAQAGREPKFCTVGPDADQLHKIGLAAKIWAETIPLFGTAGEKYLRRRHIWPLPECITDLRFHSSCPRGREKGSAIVAAMRDVLTGKLTGVHRTFVTNEGRKDGGTAKLMLGKAGAVMLDSFDEVSIGLHIGEGIETTLTARCGGWAPCWAMLSAGAMRTLTVLPGVETLTMLVDADEPGRRAAQACGERWVEAGAKVRLIEPKTEGADWNDFAAGLTP